MNQNAKVVTARLRRYFSTNQLQNWLLESLAIRTDSVPVIVHLFVDEQLTYHL